MTMIFSLWSGENTKKHEKWSNIEILLRSGTNTNANTKTLKVSEENGTLRFLLNSGTNTITNTLKVSEDLEISIKQWDKYKYKYIKGERGPWDFYQKVGKIPIQIH